MPTDKPHRQYHYMLIKAFIEGFQLTAAEAHTMVGSQRPNIDKMLTLMHKHGIIYVAGHKKSGPTTTRVWALRNNGQRDAERPQAISAAVKCKRYRSTKRATSGGVRLGIWGL